MLERFTHHKRLILHYYLAMLLIGLLFWWWITREQAFDEVIISMLGVYVLVFPIVIIYTRK